MIYWNSDAIEIEYSTKSNEQIVRIMSRWYNQWRSELIVLNL